MAFKANLAQVCSKHRRETIRGVMQTTNSRCRDRQHDFAGCGFEAVHIHLIHPARGVQQFKGLYRRLKQKLH